MQTVILTDAQYRSAIAAARTFGRAGYRVVAVKTGRDSRIDPPVFSSRYVAETRVLTGFEHRKAYSERLLSLVQEYERPVIFPIGADTLKVLSSNRDLFSAHAAFLAPPLPILRELNDKEIVHRQAQRLGLTVPTEYAVLPDRWPVIIKPHCGETYGLKAKDRYRIAHNQAEYYRAMKHFSRYEHNPIAQQVVEGTGSGACLLLDEYSRLMGAFCHRRIREYPISGGPSSCCVSVYDEEKIQQAFLLLRAFHFTGLAMVEFKGDAILEVNPRVWGSFPLTELAESPIALHYAEAALGQSVGYRPKEYKEGVKMRFTLNDTLATFSLLGHGRFSEGFAGLADMFTVRDALKDPEDPKPFRAYLRSTLLKF